MFTTDIARQTQDLQLAGFHSDNHHAVGANYHANVGMFGCQMLGLLVGKSANTKSPLKNNPDKLVPCSLKKCSHTVSFISLLTI